MIGALLAAALVVQEPPPVRLVATHDTVLLYLSETPPRGGFVVYRSIPGGARTRLTEQPILRVREPAVAAGLLGADLPMALRAVRAVDEGELLRRMVNDRFAGNVLASLSRPAAQVLGRLFVDTAATAGATYEYRVVFTNDVGEETDSAVTARVRVVDVPPAAPTQLMAKAGDHEVRLTWSYPRYRGEAGDLVLGFHLYRAEGAGPFRRLTSAPIIRNDATPFGYTDREPANEAAYRYQLTAIDLAGRESAPSNLVGTMAKDVTPPAVPTDLAARPGNGVVYLTWRLAPEVDIAGYYVERATKITDPGRRLNRDMIPAARPTWTDTVPAPGQYFYRVLAVDQAGNESLRSNALSVVPEDKTPPAPPTDVTVTIAPHKLTIRWARSSSRGVRGYHVYRGDVPEHMSRRTPAPITATQYADSGEGGTGITPGRSYIVEVSALDSAFNESPKVRLHVKVPDTEAPDPPSAFDVRNVAGRYAEVEWSSSPSLDVRAYVLTRLTAGDSAPVTLVRLPEGGARWRDTLLVHGRRYVYRLVAVDSVGNRSTARVDTVEFKDFTPPPPPRMAAARATPAGVVVTWERVIANELVGYHVYRSPLPSGHFTRLTTQPVSALTFTDPAGRKGLFYVVRAVDKSRNESSDSPPAEVVP